MLLAVLSGQQRMEQELNEQRRHLYVVSEDVKALRTMVGTQTSQGAVISKAGGSHSSDFAQNRDFPQNLQA